MAIKLSKACKELNIGMSTIVEFAAKHGVELTEDPNIRIADDLYLLLANAFNKDMALKLEAAKLQEERQKRDLQQTVSVEEEKKETEHIKISVNKPKVVGKIDLSGKKGNEGKAAQAEKPNEEQVEKQETVSPNEENTEVVVEQPKKEENEVKQAKQVDVITTKPEADAELKETVEAKQIAQADEPKHEKTITEEKKHVEVKANTSKQAAPTAEKQGEEPAEVEPKEQKPVEQKAKPEIFTLSKPELKNAPKVIGKIDLNSINQQTHPRQKTKEEKKREREERKKQQQAASGANADAGKNGEKRKRERIKRGKVDVNDIKNQKQKKVKKPVKVEVDDEEVQRQIKETIARLQGQKGKTNASKYRKEKREHVRQQHEEQLEQEQAQSKVLKLTEFVTANELAVMMNISVNQVISTCFALGLMVSINQRLDAETINIVAEEFGYSTEFVSAKVVDDISDDDANYSEADLETRPPIVTVMGHVDHGKTSLLDHIRNTNVIAGEAGGITQHIGAYNVKLKNGRHITFLDTPGHEAFTAMRARGAKVTDIAIIIIAADDAVMPQTVEAINHAQAAGVPMIFAINKCDKPGANPDKIKEQLSNMNILVEDWGGKYQSQDISAKKGDGVFELLEKVLLEADMLDLKANPSRRAKGSIIESSLDKGRGYVATVLVSDGTLRMGDVVLAGTAHGRIKAMFNERNQKIKEALPGEPALILGLNGAPQAGDDFNVMNTEQEAREIANKREQIQREMSIRTKKHVGLEEIGRRLAIGDFKELNIIVKGDVDGSVEALSDSLIKLSTENIQVNVIHKAVGAISDSDILLAVASDAIIVGFQVRPTATARKLAEKEEIDIRLYSIIYDAIEEIKSAMAGMLAPEIKEQITATLEVLQTFRISKVGTIAGCIVRDGKVKRSNKVRVIRDGIVIHTGDLASLKRQKDDVKEVGVNTECGLSIKSFNDIVEGDMLETFETVEVKKEL
ncbi:MAG: translation initiation factor IF-2 [Paludibacteraceae bacterium]|nr:translation initiation factor IF-2 [Paludibacteraceae bacterium]